MMASMIRPFFCSSSVLTAALISAFVTQAGALTPISFTGSDYTENFDTLPNTGSPTFAGAGPFDVPDASGGSLAGWSFYKSGGSGANALFKIDNGSLTSGSVYSYGTTSATDRALGSLASGTTASTFGLTLTNDTASTLTSFTLTYTGEQWRRGSAAANTLAFSFAQGATDISNGSFIDAASLSFIAPVTTGMNAALDGSLPANQTAISQTISGLSWAPGTTLTLRWVDIDNTGSDDGLAIDNLTFAAISQTLRTLVWNTTGGTWDTTTANWTGDGTTFQSGDAVRFTDAHVGAVTVDAGGVTPGQMQVENTTGTYAFSGGAITSSGKLTKSGAGTLTLGSAVSMTQGIQVDGGTLQTTASEVIDDSNSVTLGSGTTLDIQNFTETLSGLNLTGAQIIGSGGQLVPGSINVLTSPTMSLISTGLQTGPAVVNVSVADGAGAVDLRINGPLTGISRLAFGGAGTTELLGDNTAFTAGISLNSGKLVIDQAAALGTNTFFFNGGTFAPSAPMTITQFVSVGGNVTIDGTNALELADFSSSFGNATKIITVLGNVTISWPVSGSSVINKAGAGTLTFTKATTYTAPTTIQEGTLRLSDAGALTNTLSIRVDPGATFDLSALTTAYTITGADTVPQTLLGGGTVIAPAAGLVINGTLAPGGTTAGLFTQTLTVQGGPLSLGSAAVLQFELGGADSASYDQLALVGQLFTLDGTLSLSLINGFVPSPSDVFTILTSNGGFSGQFANVSDGRVSFADGSFSITQNSGSVVLGDFAPIPEPGVSALLVIALAGVSFRTMLRKIRSGRPVQSSM